MAPGIRIVGSQVTNCDVALDETFMPCPVAHALDIPLMVKRESGPGAHCDFHVAVRFMTDPRTGLAPMDGQYGGIMGPVPLSSLPAQMAYPSQVQAGQGLMISSPASLTMVREKQHACTCIAASGIERTYLTCHLPLLHASQKVFV
ncbi:unnamed protein product [Symbiodinium natans]|uniref:Uncharacterized protein n=1 Tax=Symbiodinium natans TaxID=878477 RepID=A0A812II75_9DINO|nr:unnamed protein product [Symbiodinium natans]